MTQADKSYYRARAEQENMRRRDASDPHIASIHLALAEISLAKSRGDNQIGDASHSAGCWDEPDVGADSFRQNQQSAQA